MLDSNFPIAEVSEIGRKFLGDEGSFLDKLFGMSLIAASFQVELILPSIMTLYKKGIEGLNGVTENTSGLHRRPSQKERVQKEI